MKSLLSKNSHKRSQLYINYYRDAHVVVILLCEITTSATAFSLDSGICSQAHAHYPDDDDVIVIIRPYGGYGCEEEICGSLWG